MKKVKTHFILMFVFFVSFLLLFTLKSYAMNLPIVVNGKQATFQSDQTPYVSNSRTMIPIRGLSDDLGYSVVWDGTNGTVKVTYGSSTLILSLNSNVIVLNGKNITIDAQTEVQNQHVYVPLRSVVEAMGGQVGYDSSTGQITISATANTYTVQSGDTLFSISQKFNTTVNTIKTLNKLSSDTIVVGQKLTISSSSSNPTPTPTPTPAPQPTKAIVTASLLNVRYGPGTTYGIAGTLTNQTIVDVQSQYNGWVQIQYGTLKGYVSQTYISFNIPTTPTAPSSGTLSGKVIAIDPGHGGSDSGAIGVDGSYEKTYNWAYANLVKSDLEAMGAKVYLTRPETNTRCGGVYDSGTTADLQCRVDLAASVNANIFMSIHMDWTPGATGTTTFYNSTNTWDGNENPYPVQSKELATYVQNSAVSALGLADRGVQNANFYVNRMAKMPSILIEAGFISNYSDIAVLLAKESQAAQAMAQGIANYFQNVK